MSVELKKILNLYSHQNNIKDIYILISKLKNISYTQALLTLDEISLSTTELTQFQNFINRLNNGEPVSKIINKREFWKDSFYINQEVLDPRPETEIIIETALKKFSVSQKFRFLDIGTGSGCLLLSLAKEFKNAHGVGIDISEKAIEVAQINKKNLNVSNVDIMSTSWNDFSPQCQFDLIVSNPPYIKTSDINTLDDNVKLYDPYLALNGGESGLDAYNQISYLIKNWLLPTGIVLLEIGINQAQDVSDIFKRQGYTLLQTIPDLQNIPRILMFSIN